MEYKKELIDLVELRNKAIDGGADEKIVKTIQSNISLKLQKIIDAGRKVHLKKEDEKPLKLQKIVSIH